MDATPIPAGSDEMRLSRPVRVFLGALALALGLLGYLAGRSSATQPAGLDQAPIVDRTTATVRIPASGRTPGRDLADGMDGSRRQARPVAGTGESGMQVARIARLAAREAGRS